MSFYDKSQINQLELIQKFKQKKLKNKYVTLKQQYI